MRCKANAEELLKILEKSELSNLIDVTRPVIRAEDLLNQVSDELKSCRSKQADLISRSEVIFKDLGYIRRSINLCEKKISEVVSKIKETDTTFDGLIDIFLDEIPLCKESDTSEIDNIVTEEHARLESGVTSASTTTDPSINNSNCQMSEFYGNNLDF